MNKNRATSSPLLQKTSPGKTAETWNGFEGILDNDPPEAGIIENLDKLDDVDEKTAFSNLDLILATLCAKGYECQPFLLNSTDYSLPWSRKRTFIFFVALKSTMFKITEFTNYFQTFANRMRLAQRQAPCLLDRAVFLSREGPWPLAPGLPHALLPCLSLALARSSPGSCVARTTSRIHISLYHISYTIYHLHFLPHPSWSYPLVLPGPMPQAPCPMPHAPWSPLVHLSSSPGPTRFETQSPKGCAASK